MDSKRKVLDKSHPARQHVIDITDLTSDTEQTPKVSFKPSRNLTPAGHVSTPAAKHDVKPNLADIGKKAEKNLNKSPHSHSKGTSPAQPIEIDDSGDEACPQVRKAVSSATPITRPGSISKSPYGASTRPVFRQPPGLPPFSLDSGKNKQKRTSHLTNAISQPSPSPGLKSSIASYLKAASVTAHTNNPPKSSTTSKQNIRDGTTTPKAAPKAITTTKSAPEVATSAKTASIQGQPVIPDTDTAKTFAKPSPQNTRASPITTSVAFRPAANVSLSKPTAPISVTANTLHPKPPTIPREEGWKMSTNPPEVVSEALYSSRTVGLPSESDSKQLSRASRKTTLDTKFGNGHMKKKIPGSHRSSKQSTSRESTLEPMKQKQKPPPVIDNVSQPTTERSSPRNEIPATAKSMLPPLKPSLVERTDVPLSKSPLQRSSHAAAVPNAATTSTVTTSDNASAIGTEDDSTGIDMNNIPEHEDGSMHEPHDSIEVEIVTVFKNQLDLYKADHQELTKKLISQELSRCRDRQKQKRSGAASFSFQSVKGIPIGMHKKSLASAPVRQLVERKAVGTKSYKSNSVTGFPNFMFYTPLKTSYLTENVQRLNTEIYVTGLDDDEDLNKDLHRGYKIDTFHDREQNGIAKQRAKQMSSYLEAAFEKVHFNAAKMLKYILDGKVHFNTAKMLKYLLDYQHAVEWIPKETVHYVIKDGSLRRKWANLTRQLPELSEDDIETANRICQTFYDSEHTSIWYLVNYLFEIAKKNSEQPKQSHAQLWTEHRCRVCHMHHCFEHGTFLEQEDQEEENQFDLDSCASDDAEDPNNDGYSDDENVTLNNRALVVRPRFTTAKKKQVLAYKWSDLPEDRPKDIKAFPGGEDAAIIDTDNGECSETCFWLKRNRASVPVNPWSVAEVKDFEHLLVDYGSSDRGPCFISIAMGKPCIEVFLKMLGYANTVATESEDTDEFIPLPKKPWYFFKEPEKLNDRQLFIPCNHVGECKAGVCSCFDNNVPCEKTCTCSVGCVRRFQGCNCKRQGKICWQDRECWCFRFNRECDQDLCGTCGADEALDPMNRDKALENVCANVHLQRGNFKRTLVGISEIVGFGLFMAEKAKAGDLVGEYKGQITSEEESSRRGRYYSHCTAFYEFSANPGKVMDSTKAGNITRFINHAQRADVINLEAKLLLCNTVVRLGFCATRDIKPGEELFFDYGVEKHTGQTLLEKNGDDLVPVAPRKLQVVRTKIKKSGKDKKKHRSNGTEVGMLNAIVGSSPNLGVFTSEPGSESDVDPMELDVPLPVEDPEDDDYVEKAALVEDDEAEATKRKILLRRKRETWGTRSDASGSLAGSFKIGRSAQGSVSRAASPFGSPSRSMKRKRESNSE